MTSTLRYSILVAALTAFQFGYNSGVINQPRDAMSNCSPEDPDANGPGLPSCIPMQELQWGSFVSIFLLGGVIGGLTGGFFATAYGRKRVIFLDNIAFVLSGITLGLATNVWHLHIGRFLAGIGAGIGTVVVPLYISEVAPIESRGAYGSLNQLSIVIGVLVSQLVGVPLSTREGWRTLFALTLGKLVLKLAQCLNSAIVPSALQLCILAYAVESPRWLASRGLVHDTRKSLSALRGPGVDIEGELSDMLGTSDSETGNANRQSSSSRLINEDAPAETQTKPLTISELLSKKALRKPLFIAFALQVIQQFSGINAAVFYSTTIFKQSYPADTAVKLTLLVSVVNLIMTLVSTSMIDRMGRRTLLLSAQAGMAASSFVVVIATRNDAAPEIVVAALMVFVGAFGLGLGAIPWLILPELVPSYAVGPASSICTATNWTCAMMIALFFPLFVTMLGYDVFIIFGLILVGAIVFTRTTVPETKGLTAEEVAVVNHYN
ncbi:hypothetical protein HDU96_001866 [Phlyctochytrium bullatum]|nr:hypothetical protein HDU96_001866 [Phlyctochytrium bullatum]